MPPSPADFYLYEIEFLVSQKYIWKMWEEVDKLKVKQKVSVNIYLKINLFHDTASFFSRCLDGREGHKSKIKYTRK